MAQRIHSYLNKSLSTSDGELGSVKDFLFDDHGWGVRYLVVETGSWLTGRSVLISPDALMALDDESDSLPVNLTEDQVRNAPDVNTALPVSREQEDNLRSYYGWPQYWADPLYPSMTLGAPYEAAALPAVVDPTNRNEAAKESKKSDPHLHSVAEVKGYHIEARDGEVGHVEDFVVEDADWSLSYLIVDTRNWLPGRKVVLPVSSILGVDWDERTVALNLTRAEIESAPEYDGDENLVSHSEVLRDYYKGLR